MTARIDLVPSAFDRLDPIARAVRWWTSQMIDIAGRRSGKLTDLETLMRQKKLPRDVLVSLPETDAFAARLTLPKGDTGAHASAIRLRLGDLAPVPPAQLQIAASAIAVGADGSTTYAIAMAKRTRLNELETGLRRKGARSVRFQPAEGDGVELKSETEDRRQRRGLAADGALALCLAGAAVAAVMAWTARIDKETQSLAEQERTLRRAAVASEAARRDAEIAENFINRGVLDRRAGALLDKLAALNAATPNGAWWTSVKWSPQEITLSLQAADATGAIEAISRQAKDWTVELAGPVNAAAGGQSQSFELRLRPRKTTGP